MKEKKEKMDEKGWNHASSRRKLAE